MIASLVPAVWFPLDGRMEEYRESVRAGGGARCRVPDHRGALRLSGEAITVAIVLALVPYLILRGLEVRTAIFVLDQGPIYKPSGSLIREAYSYTGASSGGRMI